MFGEIANAAQELVRVAAITLAIVGCCVSIVAAAVLWGLFYLYMHVRFN